MVLLGHAPHHADDFIGIAFFFLADFPQRAVDFFFGVFANAAGVVEDAIGFGRCVDHRVAMAFQVRDDHLAVQNIHLAADSLDVDAFVHRL